MSERNRDNQNPGFGQQNERQRNDRTGQGVQDPNITPSQNDDDMDIDSDAEQEA